MKSANDPSVLQFDLCIRDDQGRVLARRFRVVIVTGWEAREAAERMAADTVSEAFAALRTLEAASAERAAS